MKWINNHKPLTLFTILVLLGLILLATGVALDANSTPSIKILGVMLLQLSGILFTTLIALIFFNIDDVKNHIASTAASLLTSKEFMRYFSDNAKLALERNLIFDKLNDEITEIDHTLLEKLDNIKSDSLSWFQIHNYYYDLTLADHETMPDFVKRHNLRSYRIKAHNLKKEKREFELKLYGEVGIPIGADIPLEDFLIDFDGHIDTKPLLKGNVKVKRETIGTMPVISMTYNEKIFIATEIDVRISYTVLGWRKDNVENLIVSYPTKGFRVTFRYLPNHQYDCTWYKNWRKTPRLIMGRSHIQKLNNGITAETNDWILPGEGVAISWYPSHSQ